MGLFGKKSGFKANQSTGEKATDAAKLAWRIVFFPFHALWKAAAFAAKLSSAWWKDRRMVHLLRGIPTLVLAGVCAYFIVGMRAGTSRGEMYREEGLAACNAQDWQKATLCLKRAYSFGITDNETLFNLARAAEASEDTATMVTMLNRLAPVERPGHLPAHFWKATQILTAGEVRKEQVEAAKVHLEHVLTIDRDHTGANALLGDIYFQQGLWHSAVEYLEHSHPKSPRYRLMLAKACLQIQDKIRAERYFREARALAKALCDRNPDDIQARIYWADATTILEEYAEAVEILAEALRIEERQELRVGLTQVYIHWADSIEGQSTEDVRQKFVLLSEGMKHNPNDVVLFDRMLTILEHPSLVGEEAKDFLNRNIVNNRAVGISHLMLGTSALINHEDDAARIHLELAFDLYPQAPTVVNNFAWFLINKDSPEPERALRLLDPVLEKSPDNHHMRDTRGQIYLQLVA